MTLRGRIAAGVLAALLVAGCMVLPGRFASDLSVRRDGSFTFAYKGEIHLLALSKLASGGDSADAEEPFAPTACQDDKTFEERDCTSEEIAEQRKEWEDAKAQRKARKAEEDRMMKSMLGGIDPADPKAAQEFAQRLARQSGWRSVVSKGDGRFDVDYAIAARLDHDFVFPVIEKVPVATPFVTVIRRSDGTVRIDAPAFSPGASGGPWAGMAMGRDTSREPGMPVLDGTFTLSTDGEVLAQQHG